MTPTDPQGAEGRETRTEWRNVYENSDWTMTYATREEADKYSEVWSSNGRHPRIAIEEVTTTVTITRHPLGGTERE